MRKHDQQPSVTEADRRQPSAAAPLLFLVGGFGFFYGMISAVDPLL